MLMENYKVEIKDKLLNPIVSESIEAENADSAYEKFIYKMQVEQTDIPFSKVYVKGGMFEVNYFEPPHFEGHQDPSKPNQNETKQQVNQANSGAVSSDNSRSVLHKLDEIHSTMKAIRWTIAGGFLFIILVISGIIKPGIFG